MTSSRLLVLLTLVGCAIKPPPAPHPIECDKLDRAEERFPDQCGEASDAGEDSDDPEGDEPIED
jgi:hypothetical protein